MKLFGWVSPTTWKFVQREFQATMDREAKVLQDLADARASHEITVKTLHAAELRAAAQEIRAGHLEGQIDTLREFEAMGSRRTQIGFATWPEVGPGSSTGELSKK